ncbi:MAG: leucine-rich repeat domain-containing protein, partial [Eubacteriales bacterium]
MDVNCLVIGKDVTDLANEIYEWGQITPSTTIIEQGNTNFIVENGWIVNTKTNTLYGAADVVSMQSRSQIDDIPNQVEHIGHGALFNYREATSIIIPPNVTSIGNQSFIWCQKLSSFEFPMKLQTVGFQAFDGCNQLKQISLGENVSFIGQGAFSSCTGVESIDIHNTKLNTISSDLFGACYKLIVLELPEHASRIETLAYRICYELKTLVINSSDLVVDENAFYSCDNLRRLVFTKGIPQFFDETLFGETIKTPDEKSYISDSSNRRGEIIPYPTLYYTAAYADEWAPNGETEWNG